MKKLRSLLTIMLFFATAIVVNAQSSPKLVAIVYHASWCRACHANGDRVNDEVLSKVDKSEVQVFVNDVSNKKTKEESEEELRKAGYYEAVKEVVGSGKIVLVDPITKKIVNTIGVSKTSEEIMEAIKQALKS